MGIFYALCSLKATWLTRTLPLYSSNLSSRITNIIINKAVHTKYGSVLLCRIVLGGGGIILVYAYWIALKVVMFFASLEPPTHCSGTWPRTHRNPAAWMRASTSAPNVPVWHFIQTELTFCFNYVLMWWLIPRLYSFIWSSLRGLNHHGAIFCLDSTEQRIKIHFYMSFWNLQQNSTFCVFRISGFCVERKLVSNPILTHS